jgi:hypothetical protein
MRRQVNKVKRVTWLLLKPVMGAKKGDKMRKKKKKKRRRRRRREKREKWGRVEGRGGEEEEGREDPSSLKEFTGEKKN